MKLVQNPLRNTLTPLFGIIIASFIIGAIVSFAPIPFALVVLAAIVVMGVLAIWIYSPLNVVRFYLVCVPLIPLTASVRLAGLPLITPQRLLFLLIFIFWLAGIAVGQFKLKRTGLEFPILLVIVVSLVPTFLTFDLFSSIFRYVAELIEYYGLIYLLISLLQSRADVRRVVNDWFWVVLGICVVVVVEVVTSKNVFRELLPGEYWPSEWALMKQGLRRAYGPFMHPIALGQYLVVMMSFFVYSLRNKQLFIKIIAIPTFVIALGMSLARTAWAGATIVLLTLFGRPRTLMRLFVFGLVLLLFLIQPWFFQEFLIPIRSFIIGTINAFDTTTVDSSTNVPVRGRLTVIQTGLQVFALHPIIGYGLNASRNGLITGIFGSFTRDLQGLENYYISLLIDGGLLLFTTKVILWFSILIRFWRGYSLAKGDDKQLMRAFLASLLGYLTTLFAVNAWPQLETIFWSVIALGVYYIRSFETSKKIN